MDPVNTAARVESATRQTGDDLLITEATRSLLTGDGEGWRQRSGVALKGKSRPVAVYAPGMLVEEALRPVLLALLGEGA